MSALFILLTRVIAAGKISEFFKNSEICLYFYFLELPRARGLLFTFS